MRAHIVKNLEEAKSVLEEALASEAFLDQIAQAAQVLTTSLKQGGRLFTCGNGGSMCDAMHFAEELTGRFRKDRPGLAATAICNPGHLTCAGNDFGFDEIFSSYVAAHGRKGDVLVGISTSGRSRNVIRAFEKARELGVQCLFLGGDSKDSPCAKLAHVTVAAPSRGYADRVQEMHIKVIHTMIELIEREIFPELYANET